MSEFKKAENDGMKIQEQISDAKQSYGVSVLELIKRAKTLPPRRVIWNNIGENSFGYIFGSPKSGKTIIAENLGLSIASGAEMFLGKPINIDNRRVLFVSLEEYWENRTQRNAKQIAKICPDFENCEWAHNFIVIDENFPNYLVTKEEMKKLELLIKDVNPGIVFIDSLSRMGDGKIEDSDVAKNLTKQLNEIARNNKISIVCIHHTPKLQGQPLSISSLAGSRIIGQECDFAIGVNKISNGTRYIKEVASRYEEESEGIVTPFTINGDCWIEVHEQRAEMSIILELDGRRDDKNRNIAFEFIRINKENESGVVKTKDLEKGLVLTNKMSRATLFKVLEDLQNDELIISEKKGEYKLPESKKAV
jgi:hypothetical protein